MMVFVGEAHHKTTFWYQEDFNGDDVNYDEDDDGMQWIFVFV